MSSSPNFSFLAVHDDLLVRLAGQAERYFSDDPNTSLLKLRQFGEALAQQAAALSGVYTSVDDRQMDVLNALRSDGVLPPRVCELFHSLRRIGNRAVHEFEGSHRESPSSAQDGSSFGHLVSQYLRHGHSLQARSLRPAARSGEARYRLASAA